MTPAPTSAAKLIAVVIVSNGDITFLTNFCKYGTPSCNTPTPIAVSLLVAFLPAGSITIYLPSFIVVIDGEATNNLEGSKITLPDCLLSLSISEKKIAVVLERTAFCKSLRILSIDLNSGQILSPSLSIAPATKLIQSGESLNFLSKHPSLGYILPI